METKTANFTLVSLVVSGMFMLMLSVQAKADGDQLKETKLSVYLHDFSAVDAAPNSTGLPVIGFAGKLWRFDQFGTLYVLDVLLTEGPELTSAKVGRFQGTAVTISLDGRNALVSSSLVFTNEAYNGSTVQILGVVDQFNPIGEYGVTSGTGKFPYATGYVTMETLSFHPSTYLRFRINTTIRHY